MTDPVAHDAPGLEAAELRYTTPSCHVYAARLDGERVRIVSPGPDAPADARSAVVTGLETWASLGSHPSISTVHARGEEPRPWLAVTAAGTPLPEAVPLSVDAARSVVADVAEALREATAAGHTAPVEPADVRVVSTDGSAGGRLDWPAVAERAGSPYAPPEPADKAAVAGRAAVFRLGALTYYAVTGQPPVAEGETATHEQEFPTPSVNSDVPAAFDAVVERALAPDPQERYASPYEFKRALLFESQPTPDPEPGGRPPGGTAPAGNADTTPDHGADGDGKPEAAATEHGDIAGVSRRRALGALGAGVVAAAGAGWFTATRLLGSETESFPTFRFDAGNTGYAPDAVGPTDGVTEAWAVDTGTEVRASPVVADGTVLINAVEGATYALDVGDGNERWTEEADSMSYTSPVIGDGVAYLVNRSGDQSDTIVARDLSDGSERWRTELPEMQPRTPALADGRLYVSGGRALHTLDAEGGDELWATPGVSATGLSGAVSDGVLFISGMTNRNPETETQWSERTRGVIALDTADGDGRWVFDAESSVSSSPAVADGTVYVGDSDSVLSAIDAADGAERWRFEADDIIASSPAVTDHGGGTVYVGSMDGNVYALDTEDGEKRWQYETDGEVISSPAVVSDTVYVGSRDENVYALDAAAGKERWRFETDGPVFSSPAVVSKTVFVGSDDGNVYALTEP